MLLKLLKLAFMLVTLPFFIVYHSIRKVHTNYKVKKYPLAEVLEKTSYFLSSQISEIQKIEGNEYAFFTLESAIYMLSVAEKLGGRIILDEERDTFFLSLLGEDYRPRLYKVFENVKENVHDADEAVSRIYEIKTIAEDDVRKGICFCSNFLVRNAQEISLWQRTVQGVSA
jgi:hypothetical protein